MLGLEDLTKQYQQKWKQQGLLLDQVNEFEKCFQKNIDIFQLNPDKSVTPIYLSAEEFDDKIVMNLYEKHLSYVTNVEGYLKKFKCPSCDRLFNHHGSFKRHLGSCSAATKFSFPGGFHKVTPTIFDRLEEFGITVGKSMQTFPYFIVYDFEAVLEKINDEQTTKLKWTAKHIPISVSITSNVPGYTDAKCIIDSNQKSLINKMMEYMGKISDQVYDIQKDNYAWVFQQLGLLYEGFDREIPMEDSKHASSVNKCRLDALKRLEAVYGSLEGYCRQCPVLAFNSQKYDINLVKKELLPWLQKDLKPVKDENERYKYGSKNKYRKKSQSSTTLTSTSSPTIEPISSTSSTNKSGSHEKIHDRQPYKIPYSHEDTDSDSDSDSMDTDYSVQEQTSSTMQWEEHDLTYTAVPEIPVQSDHDEDQETDAHDFLLEDVDNNDDDDDDEHNDLIETRNVTGDYDDASTKVVTSWSSSQMLAD